MIHENIRTIGNATERIFILPVYNTVLHNREKYISISGPAFSKKAEPNHTDMISNMHAYFYVLEFQDFVILTASQTLFEYFGFGVDEKEGLAHKYL